MIDGLKIVLIVFFITFLISLPLGFLVALLRLSAIKILSGFVKIYILIMRGTPLLLQMIFVFFGLPYVGIVLDRLTACLLTFCLNYTAYFAEIFRGGIKSIDRGQFEASRVLDIDKFTMYKKIILPQVMKNVLLPISNETISLIKDTSLVYVLGLNDILRIAQVATTRTASLMPLLYAGLIYLFLTAILTRILDMIEKHYSYYVRE
ncbi:MAG: amino acid ABC transporter permease [Peptoniphilaceae bacterium]|nr:amino acid ABC transporter permease [Peptoniphilaceae bacterium]MDY6019457.1 amino acid ABC transporter permease [Anaerococcus sp.]